MPGEYRSDFPTRPIGGGNPYHCCASCGRSVPEINGRVLGHYRHCAWRHEALGGAAHSTSAQVREAFLEELGALLGRWGAEISADGDGDLEVTIPAVWRDGSVVRPSATIDLGPCADGDSA